MGVALSVQIALYLLMAIGAICLALSAFAWLFVKPLARSSATVR